MSDSVFTDYLKSFGLTGQEALIYQVLLQNEAMTGYEIARESGISRSNVYGSLVGLADKGAAYLIEGTPARYVAVDVPHFCDHTLEELQRRAEYLRSNAPEKQRDYGAYITVKGSRHIRDLIRDMMRSCQYRLYILAEAELIREYEPELLRLIAEGKKIVLMTSGYALEGAIVYETQPERCQIRFITDSSYVLTGELTGSAADSCLYSGQPNLVAVMKEALKNRITLIQYNEEAH